MKCWPATLRAHTDRSNTCTDIVESQSRYCALAPACLPLRQRRLARPTPPMHPRCSSGCSRLAKPCRRGCRHWQPADSRVSVMLQACYSSAMTRRLRRSPPPPAMRRPSGHCCKERWMHGHAICWSRAQRPTAVLRSCAATPLAHWLFWNRPMPATPMRRCVPLPPRSDAAIALPPNLPGRPPHARTISTAARLRWGRPCTRPMPGCNGRNCNRCSYARNYSHKACRLPAQRWR